MPTTPSPDALLLEIYRRNARLRAWRACGVPVVDTVEMGHFFESGWRESAAGTPLLIAICGTCGEWLFLGIEAGEEKVSKPPCPHLSPLLGDDPPEVVAITELELLAGEGG